ncbi:hypothetical protein P9139_21175 [Curtobacterium flaccumfaciens]|nr:hypothetical protein P9139_21175 [Curtobacterium flaccumfaciens]
MTRSNRTLNRIILFVLGLVAIVVGLVIGAGVLPAVRDALAPYVDIPDASTSPRRRSGSSPASASSSSCSPSSGRPPAVGAARPSPSGSAPATTPSP